MTAAEEIKAVWEQQPEEFPVFLEENLDIFEKIDNRRKKENEEFVREFSKQMQKKLRQKPKKADAQKRWEQELEQDFMNVLGKETTLCLSDWINPQVLDAGKRETKHFIDKVRNFDETLKPEHIWQALRNYFIYAIIVEMQGEEQNAANPILAYSLLYPYTDNYIDDHRVSREEKDHYNRIIASKLKGEPITIGSLLEEKTCSLLDMILNEYEGEKQKRIAETLLRLLEAQTQSISQQETVVAKDRLLDISICKGSTSVLADYLFAASDWLENEEIFYLKFGFLLQLLDDLQDIDEDRGIGTCTLMTQAEEQRKLEQCVNRLLWFSWNVIREFTPRNPGIKDFVLKYCVEVLLLAAAANQQFFSGQYLKALEAYLPFSLEFLKESKQRRSL